MTIRKRTARILRKAAAKLDPVEGYLSPSDLVSFNRSALVDLMAKWDREKPRPNMVNHGPEGVIGTATG